MEFSSTILSGTLVRLSAVDGSVAPDLGAKLREPPMPGTTTGPQHERRELHLQRRCAMISTEELPPLEWDMRLAKVNQHQEGSDLTGLSTQFIIFDTAARQLGASPA